MSTSDRAMKMPADIRKTHLLFMTALGLICLLLYGRMSQFEFCDLDDRSHLFSNPHINRPEGTNYLRIWQKPYFNLYIPSVYTAWGVVADLTRQEPGSAGEALRPGAFHLLNILFHTANVLLVYLLLFLLFKQPLGALAGALIFAIHPLQIEAVAWISALKDVLSGFFSLLALFLVLRCQALFQTSFPRNLKDPAIALSYGGASLCYALGVLSKPSVVIIPLLCVALLWFYRKVSLRQSIVPMVPWLGLSLVLIVLTGNNQVFGPNDFIPPLWLRPFIAMDALSFYLGKVVFPFPLIVDYSRSPEALIAKGTLWYSWMPIVGLAALLGFRKSIRDFLPPFLLLTLILAPILGFIPFYYQLISTVADRYMYLGLFAVALAVTVFFTKGPLNRPAQLAFLTAVATLLVLNLRQGSYWKSSLDLFKGSLAENEQSWFLQFNLAEAYHRQGNLDKAIPLYAESCKRRPSHSACFYNLGLAYTQQKKYPEAEQAIRHFLAFDPKDRSSLNMLALTLQAQGRYTEAIKTLQKAMHLAGDRHDRIKAKSLVRLGEIYSATQQSERALQAYQAALDIVPANYALHNNIGILYSARGNHSAAERHFSASLKLKPDFASAHFNLGLTLFKQKKWEAAIIKFRDTLALSPQFRKAEDFLRRIEEMKPKNH